MFKFLDTETSILKGYPFSASCVQRLDDSRTSAIRITSRSSLRSSSVREPRYPLLGVIYRFNSILVYIQYIVRYIYRRGEKIWGEKWGGMNRDVSSLHLSERAE